MSNPIIVLTSQTMPMEEPFRQRYVFTNSFNMDAIRRAGGIPVLPGTLDPEDAEELLSQAGGLLLTGGKDISPALYGEETLPVCGKLDPMRDESDRLLFETARRLHKPILCICRGFQMANVLLGGSLWQDIPTQYPTELRHANYPEYTEETAHRVQILPDTPLHALLGADSIPVNSLHHQAVHTLAPVLAPMAAAPDGIVEAWYLKDSADWLWGIQWHPEMLQNSPRGDAILSAFLDACRA